MCLLRRGRPKMAEVDVNAELAALRIAVAQLSRKLGESHVLSRGMIGDDRLDPHKIVVAADELRNFGHKPKDTANDP
jgi:hypothetical protein